MTFVSKVDTLTPWSAGMVVMLKKSGEVRICVNLKPLNESVLREVHPILLVDENFRQTCWGHCIHHQIAGFGKSLYQKIPAC